MARKLVADKDEAKRKERQEAYYLVNRTRQDLSKREQYLAEARMLVEKNELARNLALQAFEDAIRAHERLQP